MFSFKEKQESCVSVAAFPEEHPKARQKLQPGADQMGQGSWQTSRDTCWACLGRSQALFIPLMKFSPIFSDPSSQELLM